MLLHTIDLNTICMKVIVLFALILINMDLHYMPSITGIVYEKGLLHRISRDNV